MTVLEKTNFSKEKLKFDKSMENQFLYFINFMKMFEKLLLFVCQIENVCRNSI